MGTGRKLGVNEVTIGAREPQPSTLRADLSHGVYGHTFRSAVGKGELFEPRLPHATIQTRLYGRNTSFHGRHLPGERNNLYWEQSKVNQMNSIKRGQYRGGGDVNHAKRSIRLEAAFGQNLSDPVLI